MMRPSATLATAFAAPSINDALVIRRPSRDTKQPMPVRNSFPDASNTEIIATAGATRGTVFCSATDGEILGWAAGVCATGVALGAAGEVAAASCAGEADAEAEGIAIDAGD